MSTGNGIVVSNIWVARTLSGKPAAGSQYPLLGFSTIQEAIDAASPGSIVLVPPGTYKEQLVIKKPITLLGPEPGQGEAVIDAAGLATVPTVWILASDVTVCWLTIQNGPQRGIEVGSANDPNLTNVVILHNTISGHDHAGIITAHAAAMRIENNLISDNGQAPSFERAGVLLYPHGPCQVKNNIICNNGSDGVLARESSTGLVIAGNAISQHDFGGITLAWNEAHVSIYGNKIRHCGLGTNNEQGGIVILQSCAELIKDNNIIGCNRYGIMWGWLPRNSSWPNEIRIEGNIIQDCVGDGIFLFSQGRGGRIPPNFPPLEPKVTGNKLTHNGRAGIYVSNVYYYSPGNARPTIFGNSLSGNTWGVYNGTAEKINAAGNWWGSSSGPYNTTLNPEGRGDLVSNGVEVSPWKGLPLPSGVECLEVTRVLGLCLVEHALVRRFPLSVLPGELLPKIDRELINQVYCRIMGTGCQVVKVREVAANVSAHGLLTSLQVTADVEISLIHESDGEEIVLGTFTRTMTELIDVVITTSGLSGTAAGNGKPGISCSLESAACTCDLSTDPGEDNVTCTVKLCTLIQTNARAQLGIPVYDPNELL